MPFTIDKNSLLIRGRKGDTASLVFDFNQDISDYTVYFLIKKSINSSEAIIEKIYRNPEENSITVKLTTEDTNKLSVLSNSYNTYYWGLKVTKGTDFAQTIIPTEFKNPPMMYIYPEIGEA